ncbi:DUF3817 domain-containing protein [Flammeovirgaceae bacterium SG7u.111]|nr:DUF3817 domain-containing protein [Flammeovirgaceae bacterium SG7u.132]WPO35951.1 DUF3817 domain-containing protein [Flammeovirgaceae bacterium SG7u.111]
MQELFKTNLGRFRVLAFAEGVSFLVILFVTMPLKYLFDNPMPNKVFGMVHGLLFVLYLVWALQLKLDEGWPMKKLGLAILASIVPFGTFWADKHLLRPRAEEV